MSVHDDRRPDAHSTEQARRDLRKSEAGDMVSADRLHQTEHSNPAAAEAVEQEASDGPGKRGVSR